MTDYNAILQYVNGEVYELEGLDSAFHVHKPGSASVAFYAPEHYRKELFVQLVNGDKMIFEQVSEDTLARLEPNNADIEKVFGELSAQNQPHRKCDATVAPVDLKDLVTMVCRMQYHITTTNGLWATDEPDAFKEHPAHHLLWQIMFDPKDNESLRYESRT